MVHVGYCIGKKWWHQGITSESLATLIRFFFKEVKVNHIESRHDPRNPNSGKVMKNCGLIYEGTIKQEIGTTKAFVINVQIRIYRR